VALAWVLALTVLRVAALAATGLELHGDEAQYWGWGKHLAFGYFTKPQLIGWIIAATTAVCGDGEACARLSSPLLHGATAMGLYALGRAMADARAGMWAAILWVSLPSVAFSSLIVSTDVPLLACWTLAVLALRRTLDTRDRPALSWRWAAVAGIALGLGLLAKYAMAYLLAGLALHLMLSRGDRWILRDGRLLLMAVLALAILAPNLVWNAQNEFATVGHLQDNASLGGTLFHPLRALAFLGEQAGVFGPLPFAILAWRIIAWARGRATPAERFLLAFALPPLIVVTVQAFLSRANANWAAAAYPTATVLVALWLTEAGRARAWRAWIVGPHLAACLGFLFLVASWPTIAPPYVSDGFARLSGWRPLAAQIRPVLDAHAGMPVLMSDRMTMASLLYYLRDRLRPADAPAEPDAPPPFGRVPVQMWDWNRVAENHYELTAAYHAAPADPVLLITDWRDPRPIVERFEFAEPVTTLTVTSFGRTRRLEIWRLAGYRDR
jgi:4-amino-4-deoxy-L-arabinose transferase-like glycosyltransferase